MGRAAEGETDIDETEMTVALFVGMRDGCPHGSRLGMQQRVTLALGSQIPEVGVFLVVDTGTATDDAAMMTGAEEQGMARGEQLGKQSLGGKIATELEREETAQHAVELAELGEVLNNADLDTGLGDAFYAVLYLLAETLLGGTGVKRVVNSHPVNGEIALLTKVTIAEHLPGEMTELYVETQLAPELARQGGEHLFEELFLVFIFHIFAFTIDAALSEEIGRNERSATAQGSQQMAYDSAVAAGNDHIRSLAVRLFQDAEILRAMEKMAAFHLWQTTALLNDFYLY